MSCNKPLLECSGLRPGSVPPFSRKLGIAPRSLTHAAVCTPPPSPLAYSSLFRSWAPSPRPSLYGHGLERQPLIGWGRHARVCQQRGGGKLGVRGRAAFPLLRMRRRVGCRLLPSQGAGPAGEGPFGGVSRFRRSSVGVGGFWGGGYKIWEVNLH